MLDFWAKKMWRDEQRWLLDMKMMPMEKIISQILEYRGYNWVRINFLLWDEDWKWNESDTVGKHELDFLLPNDKGALLGYMLDASMNGYSIIAAAPDPLTGLYLEKVGDKIDTNITLEVMEALDKLDGFDS